MLALKLKQYHLRNATLSSYFLEYFCQQYMLNFAAGFLWMYKDNDTFSLDIFISFVMLMDFLILKKLCIPDINPT